MLWVGPDPLPDNVRAATNGWDVRAYEPGAPLSRQFSQAKVVILSAHAGGPQRLGALLNMLEQTAAVGVVLLDGRGEGTSAALSGREGQFLCLPRNAAAGELNAALRAAASLQPSIRNLREELSTSRAYAAGSEPASVEQIDEEMRMAARLQRDFLPHKLPEVDPARFAVLYRPANWVSGDIYDVARLDETHLGFYVADAVGHGMPAALLTMFIKHALKTKRILGHSYRLVAPHEALGELNRDICDQNLTSCQFCTGIYCLLDVETLTLSYSRAGHPEPLLLRPGQAPKRLDGSGSLLGVFPEETFTSQDVQLAPGDRLILYSDGVEDALLGIGAARNGSLEAIFGELAALPREEMLLKLTARIEAERSAEKPEDDITVAVLDIDAG